jgi:hypothetical protein
MTGVGTEVGPYTAVAPFDLPEVGAWFLADGTYEGRQVWLRIVGAEQGRATVRDVATMHDRLRHLQHPCIPEVVHHDEIEGHLAVAAPVGLPISELLALRAEPAFTMTPATVLDFACELADVLVHAHERGRPHGHLSPAQIWLADDGRLVVWGFGSGPDTQGDLVWYPPERARGRRPSGDADQWALGAITAALITGRVPWRSAEPLSEAKIGDVSHLFQPVLDQWKPLGRLLQRALSPEPRERFPSAHPVKQALVALFQRVRQPSDRVTIGHELMQRLGGSLPQPVPVVARSEPVVVKESPVSALDGSGFDPVDPFDMDTMRGTTPTMVPQMTETARPPTVEDPPTAGPAVVRGGVGQVTLQPGPEGDAGPITATDGGPRELGDLEVAERIEAIPLDDPREMFDIRRVAPVFVAVMVVLLVMYLLTGGG